MNKNNDDLDRIFSEIDITRIPTEYILSGTITTDSGKEIFLDGDSLRILLTNGKDLSDEDYESFKSIYEEIYAEEDSDQCQIDLYVDIEKIKRDIRDTAENFLWS